MKPRRLHNLGPIRLSTLTDCRCRYIVFPVYISPQTVAVSLPSPCSSEKRRRKGVHGVLLLRTWAQRQPRRQHG